MQGATERTGSVQLGKEKAEKELIAVYNYLIEKYKEDGVRLFSEVHNDRRRENRCKLKHFTLRVG